MHRDDNREAMKAERKYIMKTFEGMKAGTRICSKTFGLMEVLYWDYFSEGKKIMCFADGKSIYPASKFDPADWEIKKKEMRR